MLPALDVVLVAVALIEDKRNLDDPREACRRHGPTEQEVDQGRAFDVLVVRAKGEAGHDKAGRRQCYRISFGGRRFSCFTRIRDSHHRRDPVALAAHAHENAQRAAGPPEHAKLSNSSQHMPAVRVTEAQLTAVCWRSFIDQPSEWRRENVWPAGVAQAISEGKGRAPCGVGGSR